MPAADEAAAAAIISGELLRWLEDKAGYQLRDELQVLTPVKRGAAGTANLNKLLKQRLNPGGAERGGGGGASLSEEAHQPV